MVFVRFGFARKELPRNQGLHRQAAIALFRALLQGIQSSPGLQPLQSQQLQNVIRNRFKQNIHEQSARRIRFAFVAGYEAIDLLDGARAGITANETRILELFNSTSARARAPPTAVLPKHLRNELEKHIKRVAKAYEPERPPKRKVLDRPLPLDQLSGKRHVPVLISANRFPALRIGKPISPEYSALLAKKIKRRGRRWDTFDRLQGELELAESEDTWDELVERETSLSSDEADNDSTWAGPVQQSLGEGNAAYLRENKRNTEHAAKLQEIVDKEQALFEKEREDRKEKRRGNRRATELLAYTAEQDASAVGQAPRWDAFGEVPQDEELRAEKAKT